MTEGTTRRFLDALIADPKRPPPHTRRARRAWGGRRAAIGRGAVTAAGTGGVPTVCASGYARLLRAQSVAPRRVPRSTTEAPPRRRAGATEPRELGVPGGHALHGGGHPLAQLGQGPLASPQAARG